VHDLRQERLPPFGTTVPRLSTDVIFLSAIVNGAVATPRFRLFPILESS